MWIAAISHVIEPQDWHRRSELRQLSQRAVDALQDGSEDADARGKGRKKRRSLNPFERKQRVLARFRAAVQQVLKSLQTGRSIVGRTNTFVAV